MGAASGGDWDTDQDVSQVVETRDDIKARLVRQIREDGWDPYSGTMSMDEFYALMELFMEGTLPLEEQPPEDEQTPATHPDTVEPMAEDPDALGSDAETPDGNEPDPGGDGTEGSDPAVSGSPDFSDQETGSDDSGADTPDTPDADAREADPEDTEEPEEPEEPDTEAPDTQGPDSDSPDTQQPDPEDPQIGGPESGSLSAVEAQDGFAEALNVADPGVAGNNDQDFASVPSAYPETDPEPVPEPEPEPQPDPDPDPEPEPEPAPDLDPDPEPASASRPVAAPQADPGVVPLDDPDPDDPNNPGTEVPEEPEDDPDAPLTHIPRTMFLFQGVDNSENTPLDDFGATLPYDNGKNYEPVNDEDGTVDPDDEGILGDGTIDDYYYPAKLGTGYARPPKTWEGIEVDNDMEAVVVVSGQNDDDRTIAGNVDQSMFPKYKDIYVRRVTAQDNDVTILGAVRPTGSDHYTYYYVNREGQSTEVSATTLPEGKKFVVHYIHHEYPIDYRIKIYNRATDGLLEDFGKLSDGTPDIAGWVRGMKNDVSKDPAWINAIFGEEFPIQTDGGAYSFTATAPAGYTLSFFMATEQTEGGDWTKGSAQLVTYGVNFQKPGAYTQVNEGWALGMEPVYCHPRLENDPDPKKRDGNKLMPIEEKGPQQLITTGTFYKNEVDAPRIVAAVLEKKAAPTFDFATYMNGNAEDGNTSSENVAGRGTTAPYRVWAKDLETGVTAPVLYDYEDMYSYFNGKTSRYSYSGAIANEKNNIIKGNILTADGWGWGKEDTSNSNNWEASGVNKRAVSMTTNDGGVTYSYTWTFQTNQSNNNYVLNTLEINRTGIVLPFFTKDTKQPDVFYREYPAENKGPKSWWTETTLPDGAVVRVEYLMAFANNQRVYRISVRNATNNITITSMNLMMSGTGAQEVDIYEVDGVTGATSKSEKNSVVRTAAVQLYEVEGKGWYENITRGHVVVASGGRGIDYKNGDTTKDTDDDFLDEKTSKLEAGFGGANVRFKLAEGYNNPYFLLEATKEGIIPGTDGKPQASAKRDDDPYSPNYSTVKRGTQNPVIPYVSDGTNPYMKYDEQGIPYPVDKDGSALYYYDDQGQFVQLTDVSLLRIRTEVTGNSQRQVLAPELYKDKNTKLGVTDVIAPRNHYTFRKEDRELGLQSQYIYSDNNGWYYIRLTTQREYKMALLTVVAFPIRYVVRYKPVNNIPNIDSNGFEIPNSFHTPETGTMPSFTHDPDTCPTFLQGGLGNDDRSPSQFDDNGGDFYDLEVHTDVAISTAKPEDEYHNYRFSHWLLVDQDDQPVQAHVFDPETHEWAKDENNEYITTEVTIVAGGFNVRDYYDLAILNGDLGTTENDIYVFRFIPQWERVENPFYYNVVLNWVDALGTVHEQNFSDFWSEILTDFKPDDASAPGPTVKVLTDSIPFQNWIAQNPTYTFWDEVNNAINGSKYDPGTNPGRTVEEMEAFINANPENPELWSEDEVLISELRRYFENEPASDSPNHPGWQEKYDNACKALLKKGSNTSTKDEFIRLGSYVYTVTENGGTITLWMKEDKGGLAFHKDVNVEPFVYGDEFYFTVTQALVDTGEEQEIPLSGIYKAYPEVAYDEIDGSQRDVLDRDAWRVEFLGGKIVSIVKNDGSKAPSTPVTHFTVKEGEGIRLFVPAARYTITELGSKSGGSYKVDVRYMDNDGLIQPSKKDGWSLPDQSYWLRGSSTAYDPAQDGLSQVSATVDFAVGMDAMVSTIHFANQTSTVALEKMVIGPYQDEAFGFTAYLVLPRGVEPLETGSQHYFNFNLYDVSYVGGDYSDNQLPREDPPEKPGPEPKPGRAKPTTPEPQPTDFIDKDVYDADYAKWLETGKDQGEPEPDPKDYIDDNVKAAYDNARAKWQQEIDEWNAYYSDWLESDFKPWQESYHKWLSWLTWEPSGDLGYLRSGRVYVKKADKIGSDIDFSVPDGSTVWVCTSMQSPSYAPNGAITGWWDIDTQGIALRNGQRICIISTVPDEGTPINCIMEETRNRGYRVMGDKVRQQHVVAGQLAYELFVNSKLEGLPATGGVGVIGFWASGLVFLFSALGLAWLNRITHKRRRGFER